MKLLHTADWHLGKKLNDYSRLSEQEDVLNEICNIADKENVDAIIIAGDLYDSFNPPNEAVELFYKTVYKLAKNGERAVIAIAGNHDSADRIEAPDPLARQCGIIFTGYPNTKVPKFRLVSGLEIINSDSGFIEIKLPNVEESLRILLTPYANEARLRKFTGIDNQEESLREILQGIWGKNANQYCDNKGINILLTHLFMMKNGDSNMEEEPDDEKHILHLGGAQAVFTENIPSQIQYTALGHLHRYHHVKGHNAPVVYSGSLLEYSFSEINQQKYVSVVELYPGKTADIKPIKLTSGKKLFRKKFEDIDLAISWLLENQETFVELTLVSESYLEASIKKRIHQAHNGIINIIPEIKNHEKINPNTSSINLSQNIRSLFKEYFKHKKGQDANKELINILEEVLNEN